MCYGHCKNPQILINLTETGLWSQMIKLTLSIIYFRRFDNLKFNAMPLIPDFRIYNSWYYGHRSSDIPKLKFGQVASWLPLKILKIHQVSWEQIIIITFAIRDSIAWSYFLLIQPTCQLCFKQTYWVHEILLFLISDGYHLGWKTLVQDSQVYFFYSQMNF